MADGGGGLRELDVEVLVELLGHLVERGQRQAADELVVRVRAWKEGNLISILGERTSIVIERNRHLLNNKIFRQRIAC